MLALYSVIVYCQKKKQTNKTNMLPDIAATDTDLLQMI